MTNDALRSDWLDRPRADRLDPGGPGFATCMAAHHRAVDGGSMGYLDPHGGLFVMTAVYLRDRGWCCDRGCRHCPYEGPAVDQIGDDRGEAPEPESE